MLKSLRLSHMNQQWQILEAKAQKQGWSYGQFLMSLCEYEQQQRYQRRIQRYLKDAKLPQSKSLANFDFACCPTLDQATVLNLSQDSSWLKRGENLLVFGPSGVGKTHLAASIGRSLIELGQRVKFESATLLVQRLQSAKAQLQLPSALTKLDKYDLLIIDDIGYVQKSEAETSVLFELIAHRYEVKSLLITSNHVFSDWDSIFADSTMAVAAIDRLVHHAVILEIKADSFRQKAAQHRLSHSDSEGTT